MRTTRNRNSHNQLSVISYQLSVISGGVVSGSVISGSVISYKRIIFN
ncbi:hypothetical protein PN437_08395 [Microcystis aeruginosa CS-564/01]|nr:hypothetical protein [Microcystis aeruginosa CS-564/01]